MRGRPAAVLTALLLAAAGILLILDRAPEPSVPAGIGTGGRYLETEGRLVSAAETSSGDIEAVLEGVSVYVPAVYEPGKESERTFLGTLDRLLVYAPTVSWPLGSRLVCRGQLAVIREPDNPGEYPVRLNALARGIACRQEAEVLMRTGGKTDLFRESARRVKARLAEGLAAVCGEEEEMILRAMLLGNGSGITRSVRETLEAGGAAHILTVSGLHVSLAGGGLWLVSGFLLSFLPWHRLRGRLYAAAFPLLRAAVTGAGVLFYMEMTGSGISVRRAGIMFLLLIAARSLGRSYDLPTGLALAAAAVLPAMQTLATSSFQMSFGAVFAVGCAAPRFLARWEVKTKSGKAAAGAVLLSLVLLPLSLEHFYVWHPWQFLVNLIILPLVPVVLAAGLLTALAAHVFLPAARLFAAAARGLLLVIRGVCRLSSFLPGHALILGRPALWQHLVWLAMTAVLLALMTRSVRRRRESLAEILRRAGARKRPEALREIVRFSLPPLFLMTAGLLLFSVKTERELTVTSLYVGQGDSHVIRVPGGGVYMVDGGRTLSPPGETVLVPYLKYAGSAHLKAVLITHPDADHTNGLAAVLSSDGFRVDTLGIPAVFRDDPALEEVLAAAAEAGTQVLWLRAGDTWQDGEVSFTVLHPPEGEEEAAAEDPNGSSLVLLIRRGEFTGLLTGDIGEDTEARLLAEGLLEEADWLKAAHHGSRFSDSEAFLRAVRPLAVTISCGRNNIYGHPHEYTLLRLAAAGAAVFRTDEDGAVTLRAYADGRLTVTAMHRAP